MHRTIFAIDPSIGSLGYALHENGCITSAGVIKQKGNQGGYHWRGAGMASTVAQLVVGIPKVHVVIETPTNWFNERGMASKDSEAVQKLYYVVGAIVGVCQGILNVDSVWGVDPNKWKGQTPKKIMQTRCEKYLGVMDLKLPDRAPHDTAEAVLLAAYAHTADKGDRWFTQLTHIASDRRPELSVDELVERR